MSEPPSPRAVVAGHGDFAAGLLDVVERIAGRAAAFTAVSGHGLDSRGIEAAIRAALEAHGATVVFTDLPAGSCTIAARRVARDLPAVSVVTGASVPMLLDFVLGAGDDAEALRRSADRAREAIQVHPGRESSGAG